jgi:hypothetical protein
VREQIGKEMSEGLPFPASFSSFSLCHRLQWILKHGFILSSHYVNAMK